MNKKFSVVILLLSFILLYSCTKDRKVIDPSPTSALPNAINDTIRIDQNTSFNGNLAINDIINSSETNTWILVSNPTQGVASVNTDGTFSYTPNNGVNGVTDSFLYELSSSTGKSDTAIVVIYINQYIANQEILHYWNFNTTPILDPTISIIPGGTLSFDYSTVAISPLGYVDSFPRTDLLTINAQNGDDPGNSLRVRCPVTSFIINAPTTNYNNIILTYAVAKSNSGPATDSVYYTIDGLNYINSGLTIQTYSVSTDPSYEVHSFDFSSFNSVSNNPNFKFKIVLVGADIATSGNNRFDNITIKGIHQ